jgi:hypothetical protein
MRLSGLILIGAGVQVVCGLGVLISIALVYEPQSRFHSPYPYLFLSFYFSHFKFQEHISPVALPFMTFLHGWMGPSGLYGRLGFT